MSARGEPNPLDRMPLPPEGLEWIERAWHELSQSRHAPETGIPISEIRHWLNERGVEDEDDRAMFRHLILAMDAEFQSWAAAERKARERDAQARARRKSKQVRSRGR